MGLLRGGTEQRGLRGLRGTAGREVRASLMGIRQSDCLRVSIEAVAGNEMQALASGLARLARMGCGWSGAAKASWVRSERRLGWLGRRVGAAEPASGRGQGQPPA